MGTPFFTHRRERPFFWISVGSVVLLTGLFVGRAIVDHRTAAPADLESIQRLHQTVGSLEEKVGRLEIQVAALEKVVEKR